MARTITGHLRVEERKGARVWVAKHGRAEGGSTRKVLGPAWAKDSGRKTERGATVWRVADGPKPEGYLTPREAQAALEDILAQERSKPATPRPRVAARTFGDACRAYLTYVRSEQERPVADSTVRNYRGAIEVHLIPAFGDETPVRRITADRINDFRAEQLTRGRQAPHGKGSRGRPPTGAPRTREAVRRDMLVLGGVLKLARKRGWIAYDPMPDVERIAAPQPSGDFNVLDAAQVEAVARAAHDGWTPVGPGVRKRTRVTDAEATRLTGQRRATAATHAAVIRFAAYTGLRLGELRALRWRDVDFARAVVHVRRNAPATAAPGTVKAPKSGRVRSVPLSDPAARVVDAIHRERRPKPDDLVFPSPATGGLLDAGDLRDTFYAALTAAGLGHLREKPENPITFHDLRHTFGTIAVAGGAQMLQVQAWMGHSNIATTMRYLHHVPRHDDAALLTRAFAVESGATDDAAEHQPALS